MKQLIECDTQQRKIQSKTKVFSLALWNIFKVTPVEWLMENLTVQTCLSLNACKHLKFKIEKLGIFKVNTLTQNMLANGKRWLWLPEWQEYVLGMLALLGVNHGRWRLESQTHTEHTCLIRRLQQQQSFHPQQEKIFSLSGDNRRTNTCLRNYSIKHYNRHLKYIFKKTEETPGKVWIKLPNILGRQIFI